jgi:hypothetical protein
MPAQIIKDLPGVAVVKYTSTTTESGTVIIDPSTLRYAVPALSYYEVRIEALSWSLGSKATLTWDGATPAVIAELAAGSFQWNFSNEACFVLTNNATTPTGKILLTKPAADSCTIILVLRKQGSSFNQNHSTETN